MVRKGSPTERLTILCGRINAFAGPSDENVPERAHSIEVLICVRKGCPLHAHAFPVPVSIHESPEANLSFDQLTFEDVQVQFVCSLGQRLLPEQLSRYLGNSLVLRPDVPPLIGRYF